MLILRYYTANEKLMSTLIYIISTLMAIILGFLIGLNYRNYKEKISFPQLLKEKPNLKVIHREPIKTQDEKRLEAIETNKPIIKTMYKI